MAIPKCICTKCEWRWYVEAVDCVKVALWPVDARCETWIDFSLMFHSSVLTHMSPVLSLGSLLETLKFTTSLTGVVCNFALAFSSNHFDIHIWH